MALTDEEIRKIYDSGFDAVRATIRWLENRIEKLEDRVGNLEAMVAKNSRNSSKPPSSDGLNRVPRTQSLRQPSGRKPGGQDGHSGNTLCMVEKPDHIEKHSVVSCGHCGRDLRKEKAVGMERRQVFDIPPMKVEVTEHQGEKKVCPDCGCETTADFPQGVESVTQYGKRIQAMAVYLTNYQLLPYKRTEELFSDLFGVFLSRATLANIKERCYRFLEPVEEWIRKQLIEAPVAHFDETGVRVSKKTIWLHIASTIRLTLYGIFNWRGKKGMEAMGILPFFKGTAIHDAWAAYFLFFCSHAMCNAHHLRELVFIAEQYKQRWAKKMIRLLCEILAAVQSCRGVKLNPQKIRRFESRYDRIIWAGYQANPPPKKRHVGRGRPAQTPALNLLHRLKKHKHETLAFLYDFSIPFDNNLAERDARMMKVQQKISGCFRSLEGAQIFCRIRSYISTVRKQSLPVLDAIEHAMNNQALPFLLGS